MKVLNKIVLTGTEHELTLSKVTIVKVAKQFFHLDKLPDGSWRITINRALTPSLNAVTGISFKRNNKGKVISAKLEGTDKEFEVVKNAGLFKYDCIQLEEAVGGWHLRYSKELFPDFDSVIELSFDRIDIDDMD